MESDFERLVGNFDGNQIEFLSAVAVRIAGLKAERWTGKVIFEINANGGFLGDLHVNKGEVVRFGRTKRKVRSRGISST